MCNVENMPQTLTMIRYDKRIKKKWNLPIQSVSDNGGKSV